MDRYNDLYLALKAFIFLMKVINVKISIKAVEFDIVALRV